MLSKCKACSYIDERERKRESEKEISEKGRLKYPGKEAKGITEHVIDKQGLLSRLYKQLLWQIYHLRGKSQLLKNTKYNLHLKKLKCWSSYT